MLNNIVCSLCGALLHLLGRYKCTYIYKMQTIERGGKPEHRHNALHMNRIHIRCVCFMQEAYSVVSNREEGIISLHFTHNSVLKKKWLFSRC